MFTTDPFSADVRLFDFAAEYHKRCEAFDRTVCTGPIGRDGIMPRTYSELGLINRNAGRVLADITERAARLGFTRREVLRAIATHPSI